MPHVKQVLDILTVTEGDGFAWSGRARGSGASIYDVPRALMNYGGKKFDGATDYLDANALTGVADGKAGTLAIWMRYANAASAVEYTFHSTGTRFAVSRTAAGQINIVGLNAAGSTILSLSTGGSAPCAAAGTYAILASWDLAAGAGTARLYVNDTSNVVETTYTDDTIDYTVAENGIGGTVAGGNLFTGDIYSVWIDFTQRLNFATESVRRKFFDSNNNPVFLGRNGELPTGTAPGLYLGLDDYINWKRNRGSLVATSFTENGTPAAPTTAAYGPYIPLQDIGIEKVVTADYTLGSTDTLIVSNRGALNTLTLLNPAGNAGREVVVVGLTAFAVQSASANVVPLAGGAPTNAILPAVAGSWARLKSNGTNWRIVAS